MTTYPLPIELKTVSGEHICCIDLNEGEHAKLLALGFKKLFEDLIESRGGELDSTAEED
jgi:hypothetical protein